LVFMLQKMCRVLEVSRSGYYAYKKRRKSQHRIDNEKLLVEIKRVYLEFRKDYGSPRIWDHLRNKEHLCCGGSQGQVHNHDELEA